MWMASQFHALALTGSGQQLCSAPDGDELVPVGKAYFGFTDEELLEIDRFVRRNTVGRFGPVREVVQELEGLVMEVGFEGLHRSSRHKPELRCASPDHRLRCDKPPSEADRLETLERMLDSRPGASTDESAEERESASR